MDANKTCGNCRWHDDEACRRNPPHATAIPVPVQSLQGMRMQLQNIAVWPMVRAEDWCGEHSPKFSLAN